MVEPQPSKLKMRVRFPSPAPYPSFEKDIPMKPCFLKSLVAFVCLFAVVSCTGTENGISPEVANYKISEITVRFTPDAVVVWPQKGAEFAASQGHTRPQPSVTENDVNAAPQSEKDPFYEVQKTPEALEYVKTAAIPVVRNVLSSQVSSSLKGSKAARLEVVLDLLDVTTGAERVVLRTDSGMRGRAYLLDAQTNALIAEQQFFVEEKALKATGNIGIIVALAVNTIDAADGQRLEKLVTNFGARINVWLTSYKKQS